MGCVNYTTGEKQREDSHRYNYKQQLLSAAQGDKPGFYQNKFLQPDQRHFNAIDIIVCAHPTSRARRASCGQASPEEPRSCACARHLPSPAVKAPSLRWGTARRPACGEAPTGVSSAPRNRRAPGPGPGPGPQRWVPAPCGCSGGPTEDRAGSRGFCPIYLFIYYG